MTGLVAGKPGTPVTDRLRAERRPLRTPYRILVDLELESFRLGVTCKRDPVVLPAVHDQTERNSLGSEGREPFERPADAAYIGRLGDRRLLGHAIRTSSRPAMRSRIDIEDEPGASTHRGADPERMVLPADERFEVIVNDGLGAREGSAVRHSA